MTKLTNKCMQIVMCLVILAIAGCGSETATFVGGFASGTAATIAQANKTMDRLRASIEDANNTADEIEEMLKSDPETLVGILDPNLGAEIARFIENVHAIEDADVGRNWEEILLYGLIGIFGGGTVTNLYKNRKTS